jgi:hypothetical protein
MTSLSRPEIFDPADAAIQSAPFSWFPIALQKRWTCSGIEYLMLSAEYTSRSMSGWDFTSDAELDLADLQPMVIILMHRAT